MCCIIGDEAIPNPGVGSLYKPKSKLLQKMEDRSKKTEEKVLPTLPTSSKLGPPVSDWGCVNVISSCINHLKKKKGAEKKKSILELFKEELKRLDSYIIMQGMNVFC